MYNIKSRIKEFAALNNLSIRSFEEICGLNRGNISNMSDDGSIGSDKLSKIFDRFPDLNPKWLLLGQMPMLLSETDFKTTSDSDSEGIPLIPFEAMAGFFTGGKEISLKDCKRLKIPGLKADFVIPVSGRSMEPLYYSGDLLACQQTPLCDKCFEWGRAYVVDTAMGVLLKRVRPGSTSKTITLVSENPDFNPREISYSDIYHIALVKGVVRIE